MIPEFTGSTAPAEELLQLLDFCLPSWLVEGLGERPGFENSLSP